MYKSTRYIILFVVLILLMGPLSQILPQSGARDSNPILHDIYKWLHILGAVIFLGNIIVTGIWMLLAEKSNNIQAIQFAVKAVNWMDAFFTAPGAALILLTGLMQSHHHGGVYTESWITAGLILFSLSGIIWLLFLVPGQHSLIKYSDNNEIVKDKLPEKFYVTLYRWYFWGIIATLLPLISMIIMVFKPKLW